MLKKITTSSVDPTALSMTFRGLLISIIPLFIAITGLDPEQVHTISDMLVEIVFQGASFYSAALIVIGLIRKLYIGRWSHPDV